MATLELAAVVAAILIGIAALFQLALVLGAPLGEATMGGRARTRAGVLEPRFRALAAASAVLLLVAAWVVLARAGVIGAGPVADSVLGWATGAVAVFMALNTLSNLSGRHPLERWGMASITLIVAVLVTYVAFVAP